MAPRSDGYPVLFVGCLEDVAACPPQQFDSFLNKARKSRPRLTGRRFGRERPTAHKRDGQAKEVSPWQVIQLLRRGPIKWSCTFPHVALGRSYRSCLRELTAQAFFYCKTLPTKYLWPFINSFAVKILPPSS